MHQDSSLARTPIATVRGGTSRRRRPMAVPYILLAVFSVVGVESLLFPSFLPRPSSPPAKLLWTTPHYSRSRCEATRDRVSEASSNTWSMSADRNGYGFEADSDDDDDAATADTSSSRLGVRKRVKAVLQKAKERTGVSNTGENTAAAARIVAEAASITSFDEADFVYRNGRLPDDDDDIPRSRYMPRNDTDTGLVAMNANGAARSRGRYSSSSSSSNLQKANLHKLQVDAMLNSNAAIEPLEPLPFTLPTLTDNQNQRLRDGERLQMQSKMAREGSGFVVLDVQAPPFCIWEILLDFEAYPDNIGTVRGMRLFTSKNLKSSYVAEQPLLAGTGRETRHYGTASITRASFVLSKFRLNIAAIHKYRPHPDGDYMVFTLDKACKNVVLQDAKGIWHTQANPDGRGPDWTRVWLLCELKVSRALPSFIVDYAAKKAMPRATAWLRPTVEAYRARLEQEGTTARSSSSSSSGVNGSDNVNGSKFARGPSGS